MNKNITLGIVAVIIAAVAFFAGQSFSKASGPRQFGQGQSGTFMRSGMGMRGGAGFAGGQIISKDPTGITVKLPNGNTQIVLMASSTEVLKSVQGSAADLSVGESVMVTGPQNSDGSVTAQTVQIRPAGAQTGQRAQ